MNATRFGLLKRDVAEAFQVTDLEWWMTALMGIGAVTVLSIAFAGFLYLVTKDEPQDIPDFVVCTCPHNMGPSPKCAVHSAEFFRRNRTNTLSIDDFRKENEWNKA